MKKYYGQFKEDKYLDLRCKLPKKGIFVDVGAGGIDGSNSYYFEKKGWVVLCIEPDKRHRGLKKRKLVDNSVVGSSEKEVDFVFHRLPKLSGLYHDKKSSVKLQMLKLDTILEKHKIENIDVLSIDVEGNETDVLSGFDSDKYKPAYIIIEHTNQFKGNDQIGMTEILANLGYAVIHKTLSNLIAKRKEA